MTIEELAEAAMSYSDNAATNILIKRLGGTEKINQFAKSIGNTSFNLGNIEPELNSDPSNVHDTSTPKDMAQSIQKLLLENSVVSSDNQQKLKAWVVNNTTGYNKIRSGLPVGWHAAEKTGGTSVISNDMGIAWSPACKPIVLAIYTILNEKQDESAQATTKLLPNGFQAESIQVTTKLILSEFSKNNTCFAATVFK